LYYAPPGVARDGPSLLSLVVAAVAACGGGSFDAGVYRDEEAAFRVGPLPAGWERVDLDGQNDLAFHHDGLGAILQVNASCNPSLDIPLVALTNHLLFGFTEREIRSQELVPMADREALLTHLTAKLDGVPRELLLTVLKKDGCVYDFALAAPPGAPFLRARPAFDALLRGFEARSTP
jgi:hypothetical protein